MKQSVPPVPVSERVFYFDPIAGMYYTPAINASAKNLGTVLWKKRSQHPDTTLKARIAFSRSSLQECVYLKGINGTTHEEAMGLWQKNFGCIFGGEKTPPKRRKAPQLLVHNRAFSFDPQTNRYYTPTGTAEPKDVLHSLNNRLSQHPELQPCITFSRNKTLKCVFLEGVNGTTHEEAMRLWQKATGCDVAWQKTPSPQQPEAHAQQEKLTKKRVWEELKHVPIPAAGWASSAKRREWQEIARLPIPSEQREKTVRKKRQIAPEPTEAIPSISLSPDPVPPTTTSAGEEPLVLISGGMAFYANTTTPSLTVEELDTNVINHVLDALSEQPDATTPQPPAAPQPPTWSWASWVIETETAKQEQEIPSSSIPREENVLTGGAPATYTNRSSILAESWGDYETQRPSFLSWRGR